MRFIYFFLQISQKLQSEFVIKAGLLVMVLSGFIIFLTILHRIKKNRLHAEKLLLEKKFNQVLLKNQVAVQEATFKTVSEELHDNIGQLMSTAMILVNITERSMRKPPNTLVGAGEALDKGIRELRSLSRSLNKDWLKLFVLNENLDAEINRINRGGELKISITKPEESLPLTAEQQFLLFRILQEAIQNALKHAKASKLNIQILNTGTQLRAEVADNGHGFDTKIKSTGLGMNNMQERAASMGGSVKWESDGKGTTILILIPIKPN